MSVLARICRTPRIALGSFRLMVNVNDFENASPRDHWAICFGVQRQPTQLLHKFTNATDAGPALPLKTALRQLYKRVHPDMFNDYPAEQADNEQSFKLLQDYLHQARSPTTGPASRTAYHFKFHLMPQHRDGPADTSHLGTGRSAPTAADTPPGPHFHLVQLSLPPPEPHRSAGGGHLSTAAGKGLVRLLELCGISGVLAGVSEQEDNSKKLTTFIPAAAEYVRQHESGPVHHEVHVANIRAALRLARQVIAGFQPQMFSGQQQVELLQRLIDALELLSCEDGQHIDLSGLHILISNTTCLNSQGTLCLDAAESADQWADFLGGVDLDFARGKKSSAGAIRQLESQVAAAVGVRMLFTAAIYLMTHEYRQFLEKLAAHAAAFGPVQPTCNTNSSGDGSTASKRSFGSVPVYAAPPHLYQQTSQQQQEGFVHEVMGYIMVNMDDSAQQVYQAIQAHGYAAAEVLAHKQQQQQELADLTSSVRARLNIRHLFKDELISADEFKAACKRLLYHRDLLLQCNIEGLSIRVSDKNKIAPDGSLVDIAWDFDM